MISLLSLSCLFEKKEDTYFIENCQCLDYFDTGILV